MKAAPSARIRIFDGRESAGSMPEQVNNVKKYFRKHNTTTTTCICNIDFRPAGSHGAGVGIWLEHFLRAVTRHVSDARECNAPGQN